MSDLRHRGLLRVVMLLGLVFAAAAFSAQPAQAQIRRSVTLTLEAGSGRVLTLSTAAANVFVADPKIAEVRPASSTSLFVFGVNAGRTTVAAMDSNGHVIMQYEVAVRPSSYAAGEARAAVTRLVPSGQFTITPQPKGMLLSGSVASPADAAQAVAILRGFLPDGQSVDNQLSVRAAVQINLRVRMVEMSRSVSRTLGVNWQVLGSLGSFATNYGLAT